MPVSPHDVAVDVLDRANAILALDVNTHPEKLRADFRRLALAMGVAALDTYLHWAIRAVDLQTPSDALSRVKISFGDLVESGRISIESRRTERKDRPQVRARNTLNRFLLTQTFQSADQVQTALSLAGVTKAFPRLAQAMSPHQAPADLRKRLDSLSHRRNKIVHEGDLVRKVKPSKLSHEKIKNSEVRDDLLWLRQFIDALQLVVP